MEQFGEPFSKRQSNNFIANVDAPIIINSKDNYTISCTIIFHSFSMLFYFNKIKLKKKADAFKQSRDWLMWFLLLIITSYINRNHLPEFSDLYELLYKDDEMLPNPDLSSFISVIRLAPLSIWINLNLRLNSQKQQQDTSCLQTNNSQSAINMTKSFVIPEIIRNHFNLLLDCMNFQHYNDFGLSICLNACNYYINKINSKF
jgi:hypothetical protein